MCIGFLFRMTKGKKLICEFFTGKSYFLQVKLPEEDRQKLILATKGIRIVKQ